MVKAVHNLLRKVEAEALNFVHHPNQDEYDRLLHNEYVFTCRKAQEYLPENGVIMDVGTAYGTVAVAMADLGYKVYACDLLREYANIGQMKRAGVAFTTCNIEKEDLKLKEPVDLVLFTEVLEHLNANPLEPIKRLKKALKPGGHILCTTPRFEAYGSAPGIWGSKFSWKQIPKELPEKWRDEHTHHYNQLSLVNLFTHAGLTVTEVGTCYEGRSHYIIGKA